MKQYLVVLLTIISLSLLANCNKKKEKFKPTIQKEDSVQTNNQNKDTSQLTIIVGTYIFHATLSNNATAAAFQKRLPLTVQMNDLNANEKYVDLAESLPVNFYKPAKIETGDLMLYGSNTLVLFYKSFSTSYSYTRLGRVNDPSGLAAALGTGSTFVTFKVK